MNRQTGAPLSLEYLQGLEAFLKDLEGRPNLPAITELEAEAMLDKVEAKLAKEPETDLAAYVKAFQALKTENLESAALARVEADLKGLVEELSTVAAKLEDSIDKLQSAVYDLKVDREKERP